MDYHAQCVMVGRSEKGWQGDRKLKRGKGGEKRGRKGLAKKGLARRGK